MEPNGVVEQPALIPQGGSFHGMVTVSQDGRIMALSAKSGRAWLVGSWRFRKLGLGLH